MEKRIILKNGIVLFTDQVTITIILVWENKKEQKSKKRRGEIVIIVQYTLELKVSVRRVGQERKD